LDPLRRAPVHFEFSTIADGSPLERSSVVMRHAFGLLALLSLSAAAPPASATPRALSAELEGMRALASAQGESLWSGYGRAPFSFLLVEEAQETLLCHPTDPQGFTPDGLDAATGCDRLIRPRSSLPASLLAAMPIFGPPSTIVVGTPAATGVSPDRWRASILHEHFHQWQDALPEFYPRVAALDLADGDETGMWMLNFPFPYEDAATAAAFAQASRALAAAVAARGSADFRPRLADYLVRRRALAATAGERNWRYLEFQLWKEGVARWTEIALAQASGHAAMRAEAERRQREVLADLESPDLAGRKRVVAYATGAGEAMLLEACGPAWRAAYPNVLALGPLLEQAAQACPGA
jgi:hypothetical protein